MDAELVEAVILLIFSSRFDRYYSEFIELLNNQKALFRQLHLFFYKREFFKF